MNSITSNNTLFIPSFSMSYTQDKTYVIENSSGNVGIAAEYVRTMPDVHSSLYPI